MRENSADAWRTFISTGHIPTSLVRPEIAASWIRCRKFGLSPWSSSFPAQNLTLLKEKKERFHSSLVATYPVMKVLEIIMGCNVSLMDGENFVFELLSPIDAYPRTFGTYIREEEVGTGNATLVAELKRPVRVDGFEHYRAVVQSYSGVSVPFLDEKGRYYGAMNINNPQMPLPPYALKQCQSAVELSSVLYTAGKRASSLLADPEFYSPITSLSELPLVFVDETGKILAANSRMRRYLPGWTRESAHNSLAQYLESESDLTAYLTSLDRLDMRAQFAFRSVRRKKKAPELLRKGTLDIPGTPRCYLLVFDDPASSQSRVKAPALRTRTEQTPVRDCHERHMDYVGSSPAWEAVDRMVNKVARVKANVLVLGETGTGKEVVARAIHRRSGRTGEFVAVNCGALPRDLLATELFGYEAGAFTGARESGMVGKFEYANGGTLFLDEIGEMPLDMQVSLLRVLQEQSVMKLGSNESKALDLRVIAATNQDLEKLVAENRFRSDLYYRLSMVEIHLPELRKRTSDIPAFVEYFNRQQSEILGLPYSEFPEEAIRAFEAYSWPGNVRELRNIIERMLIMQGEGSLVTLESLPRGIASAMNATVEGPSFLLGMQPGQAWRTEVPAHSAQISEENIRQALSHTMGDVSQAAIFLGVSETEMLSKMNEYGMRHRIVYVSDN